MANVQIDAETDATLQGMHDHDELMPLVEAYMASQAFREKLIRDACAWIVSNQPRLCRISANALRTEITAAFPDISDRELVAVARTLKSVADTMQPSAGRA